MDRSGVARILTEVAAMLELKGENPFKVRAYENAARALLGYSGDLAQAVSSGSLREVPGIGAGLFAAIQTILATGTLPLHEQLRREVPPGLRECIRVPGLGVRKARQLHAALGIDSLASLEAACREGRLATVKGFSRKSEERILRGIEVLRSAAGLHRYPRARERAEDAVRELAASHPDARIEIAGSLRRRKEVIRDIDLVAASVAPDRVAATFRRLSGVVEVTGSGETKTSIRFADGLAADLRVVSAEDFPAALLYFTGSKEHNTLLRGRARAMGLKLNEYGLYRGEEPVRVPAFSEEEIYSALDLAYVEPELREGLGEIEAAELRRLPALVSRQDLRGVIHVHTTESDGRNTLEEMVAAARSAGYEYVAITDHSQTASYAGGLTPERVLRQRAAIRALNARMAGFRIFHGTEADILADGSIDFGDEFLETFDLVVASVHSRFGLARDDQTRRLIRAVENPRVSVLGHPTGRLLLSRDPIDVDVHAVIEAAARSGCAIEVNGNPERLELDWRLCREAVEHGALVSIDPDAHSVREIGLVSYALQIARKGWVSARSVLNAKSASELEEWLERRKCRARS